MCLHFGEQGSCFYGGVMVEDVYPAVREADAIVMLCPNYKGCAVGKPDCVHQPPDFAVPDDAVL